MRRWRRHSWQKAGKGKKGKKDHVRAARAFVAKNMPKEARLTTDHGRATIDERESSAAMRRPSAAADDPAPAAIRRRLSGKQPPVGRPALSIRPTAYRGGKIYHSETGKKFRIYDTIGDKVEGATRRYVPGDDSSMKQAWADACLRLESIRR